jgi:hypothetical protein
MATRQGNNDCVDLKKRLLKVENVVGENVRQVEIKSDIEFPVEVKKIWEVDAEVEDVEFEIIPDKVIVTGTIHKQVFFVADEDIKVGGVHFKKGEVFEKTVEEKFTEFVDVPGAREDFDAEVDVRVEFVNHEKKKHKFKDKDHHDDHDHDHDDDDCHDKDKDCKKPDHSSTHEEKWHDRGKKDNVRDVFRQIVVLEIFVKVFETVQLEIITDVESDLDLDVVKELLKVESVIGEQEKQTEIIADIEFPRDRRPKKVKEVITDIRDVETEIIRDKVIVEGILHKQIIYVEARTNRVFELSVDEPFTVSVDIPGAREDNKVKVDVDVEFVEVDLRHGNEDDGFRNGRQTAVLAVFVKVTETLQLEVVTDIIGDGVEVERELLRVQGVIGENERQVNLKEEITIDRPVKKILETITDVKINRKDSKILDDKVIVEGILCKQIFFVDECDDAVFEKSVKERFTTFVDVPGAREGEDQTLDVDVEVEFVDHHLSDYPKWICGAFKDDEFDPDDFPIDQTVVLAVFAKVTETLQLDVVVDVICEEVEDDEDEDEDVCPEANIRIVMIQKGDTLFRIARRYNTTVEAIMELNPGIDPNNLQIGQQIRVCAIDKPKG